jgi:hypothetical protein
MILAGFIWSGLKLIRPNYIGSVFAGVYLVSLIIMCMSRPQATLVLTNSCRLRPFTFYAGKDFGTHKS